MRSDVIMSETGMRVQRLMPLEDADGGLMVRVRWDDRSLLENMLKPLQNVFEDVFFLLKNVLQCLNKPLGLFNKVLKYFGL